MAVVRSQYTTALTSTPICEYEFVDGTELQARSAASSTFADLGFIEDPTPHLSILLRYCLQTQRPASESRDSI